MITDKEMQNFSSNVKRLRVENKLTKKQMAEICDVGIGTINKLEQEILPPRLGAYILIRIYRYFKIMPSDMFVENMHRNI